MVSPEWGATDESLFVLASSFLDGYLGDWELATARALEEIDGIR